MKASLPPTGAIRQSGPSGSGSPSTTIAARGSASGASAVVPPGAHRCLAVYWATGAELVGGGEHLGRVGPQPEAGVGRRGLVALRPLVDEQEVVAEEGGAVADEGGGEARLARPRRPHQGHRRAVDADAAGVEDHRAVDGEQVGDHLVDEEVAQRVVGHGSGATE